MITVKTRLRESTVPGKAGRLTFRLIHRRKVRTISLPYLVRADEWCEAKEDIVISGSEPAERLAALRETKRKLERDKNKLTAICRDYAGCDSNGALTEIVETYRTHKRLECFLCLLEEYRLRAERQGHYTAVRHLRSTMNSFSKYLNGHPVIQEEVTPSLIREYIRYLQQKGLKNSTILFYIRILRRIWNKAVEEKLITGLDSPFTGIRLTVDKPRKLAVSEQTITQIEALELGKASAPVRLARDLFLFSYYTRGMPFIDIALLKKADLAGGFLTYRRHKTGQPLHIKLLPGIKRLIARYRDTPGVYVFPILKNPDFDRREYESALRLQNLRLKKVGKLLKNASLPLSTYVPRHSWASIAQQKGIPEEVISHGMGHTSIKTTRIYIASSHNKYIDLANEIVVTGKKYRRALFDWSIRI